MNKSEPKRTNSSPEGEIAGARSRVAALRLIDAVLRQGQRLDTSVIHATRNLTLPEDRALAIAIATEVLRHLPDLDALIDSATEKQLPQDVKARSVLRLALTQALILGTPPHAAIATALPLVLGGPRRLVHGVFGTLIRRGAMLPEIPTLPAEVVTRWTKAWGPEAVADAARAIAAPPPLDLALRDPNETRLEGEELASGHRRLPRGLSVIALPGYAEGRFWVQNIAAQIPVPLLGKGNGRTVLDLCAAPGGKTMQLAAAGWNVIAVEQHSGRIQRLRENLSRTALAADIVEADVMAWEPPAPVDAIMLDAPCTATGIFARHPDVLHRIGAKDIASLSALQGRMLARAVRWLKPDGCLVYATCSMEPEEGEEVIAASGLTVDPVSAHELPLGLVPAPEGWVRILPKPGLDGFFMARLKQK
ncbi:transcription antitermination factor NusB [Sphingomonas sp.]|uniref:RsmB/NOP family class I SAM-dependent RNA methyltransferase n=1 Tax=Sphingomonas sp. TaxID=28214 RepID=UPI0025DB4B5A|nr:transcription antitermination factor NusB [Sphingomonas sp.]